MPKTADIDVRQLLLEASWQAVLKDELNQEYMRQLNGFLNEQKQAGKLIYPPSKQIFNALNSTPLAKVRVVILGQDPYHQAGQAHGLAFSVAHGIKVPPSLRNIYKELQRDLGFTPVEHGNLQHWAEQGVLLLNAILTVEHAKARSHVGKGWERFTDKVVSIVNEKKESVVFILWGADAQKKGQYIDRQKHLVLESVHPSPLSAYRGFLGNAHFSNTNNYLLEHGQSPIDWQLPAQGPV